MKSSASMYLRRLAVHFLIHSGESASILSLILKSEQSLMSDGVTGSRACKMSEFLERKQVFLSTS